MSRKQRSETTGDWQATGGAENRAGATADAVFGILARATNRYALQCLIECDRKVSVDEFVEYVVTATGNDPDETVGEFRGSVCRSAEDSTAEFEPHGPLRYDRQTQAVQSAVHT